MEVSRKVNLISRLSTNHSGYIHFDWAFRHFLPDYRQPSILADHAGIRQALEGSQDALGGRRRHPLEVHEIVYPQRLQLNDWRGQVCSGYFGRSGLWQLREGAFCIQAVAETSRGSTSTTSTLSCRRLRYRGNG